MKGMKNMSEEFYKALLKVKWDNWTLFHNWINDIYTKRFCFSKFEFEKYKEIMETINKQK